MALLSDPELLLLDEPANGLDPAGIVAMRELLRHLTATGKTVLVSSHILPEVQQLADVVGIIDRGRLVREGPHRAAAGRGRAGPGAGVAAEVERAASLLARLGRLRRRRRRSTDRRRAGWLLRVPGERAGEVNRLLAAERHLRQRARGHQRPRVGVPVAHRERASDGHRTGRSAAGWGQPPGVGR